MPRKKRENYIDNKEFSEAVANHVRGVQQDLKEGKEARMISDYIAESFMKIATGLSHSPNFINYTYRDDMVMDAVENCIKAINNYDIDKPTRTGKPNSFSYFTQISYFAFLRRIAKEKKQTDIKQKLIETNNVEIFADFESDDLQMGSSLLEKMRQTQEDFYDESKSTGDPIDLSKTKPAKKKARKKSAKKIGSLSNFLNN